jgi:Mg2+ and Co2+ transporter CorA
MRIALNIVGAILVLLGALWALQGLNVIGGSFMTGQTHWLVIGVVMAIAGVALLGWVNRRRA